MEFGPRFDQPLLRTRDLSDNQVDWIHTEDRDVVLIERVKVWSMVLRPGLCEHPDHNAEEPTDFWHGGGLSNARASAAE